MLNAKYNVYKHVNTGETIVRTTSYSLPGVLHEHISVITPTTYFGTMRVMKSYIFRKKPIGGQVPTLKAVSPGAEVPASCVGVITPACLFALYNAAEYVPTATDKNVLGVAGYLDQFANYADMQTFLETSEAVEYNFTTAKINGGGEDQNLPGDEAFNTLLDWHGQLPTFTIGTCSPPPEPAFPRSTPSISTGGSPPFTPDSPTPHNTNESYLEWLKAVSAELTVPQTITTSYGDQEHTDSRWLWVCSFPGTDVDSRTRYRASEVAIGR